jgi:hypothetical protein
MNSEKTAGILGGIVAALVLAAAFYTTFGQGRLGPAKQPQTATVPQGPVNPPPAVKGPVVREVPQ